MIPRYSTIYKITGTDTFRLSSTKIFGEYGGNTQNKADEIRKIFIPDEGKILLQVDQAGAEALVVAYLCTNGKFRELFLNNIKSHVFVAMHIFADYWAETLKIADFNTYLKSPVGELKNLPRWKDLALAIKNHSTYYYIGKKSCHSFNYGLMPKAFMETIVLETAGKIRLSLYEATRINELYHKLFPEIHQWHTNTINMLSNNKCILRNLFGYPREFGDMWGDNLFRKAYAFVPQSTVGTITNLAIAELHDVLEGIRASGGDTNGAEILQNGHDSILSQVNNTPEALNQWNLIVKSHLERTLCSPRGEVFKMKSESGAGMNWGKYDSIDNPNGLKEI